MTGESPLGKREGRFLALGGRSCRAAFQNAFLPLKGKSMAGKSAKNRKPLIVISIFVVIWLAGILTEEPRQVLAQAIRVCLSCIGIG